MEFVHIGLHNHDADAPIPEGRFLSRDWRRRIWRALVWKAPAWRVAATVNTCILALSLLVLITLLITSSLQAGGPTSVSWVVVNDCDKIAQLDVAIHLILNIFSSLIIASSNFFMQILNAPTREEIDKAHARGKTLEIGVSSVQNLFWISNFKRITWLVLFLSSVPIHLIFNSTIFQTDHREAEFNMTIATPSFVSGGAYAKPGASLSYATGFTQNYAYANDQVYDYMYASNYSQGQYDTYWIGDETVLNMSSQAASWTRLDPSACKKSYITGCQGLQSYRNLIAVVDTSSSWARETVWPTLSSNESEGWDKYINASEPNALWSTAQCSMVQNRIQVGGGTLAVVCRSSCSAGLGYIFSYETAGYWYNGSSEADWTFDFFASVPSGLNSTDNTMTLQYCLGEPPSYNGIMCQIGVANALLLGVSLCVVSKLICCLLVLRYLPWEKSIVTLGDAVESFICQPDSRTEGCCLVERSRLPKVVKSNDVLRGVEIWRKPKGRRTRASSIPKMVWARSYTLFALSIGFALVLLPVATMSDGGFSGTFGQNDENEVLGGPVLPPTFVGCILLANSAQLLLTFCYFAFSNFFTRLQLCKEWAALQTEGRPLRVSKPKGHQVATYRLQLPYKYSVPLIGVAIFLHFLVSNTIYVLVVSGSYFDYEGVIDPSLGDDYSAVVGYSEWSLLVLIIVSTVLILVPIVLSRRRLPVQSTIIGTSSLAISAACHASTLPRLPSTPGPETELQSTDTKPLLRLMDSRDSQLPGMPSPAFQYFDYNSYPAYSANDKKGSDLSAHQSPSPDLSKASSGHGDLGLYDPYQVMGVLERKQSDIEMQDLIPQTSSEEILGSSEEEIRIVMSQRRLKWGVVRQPEEWYARFARMGEHVGHLSFSTEEMGGVGDLIEGQRYA